MMDLVPVMIPVSERLMQTCIYPLPEQFLLFCAVQDLLRMRCFMLQLSLPSTFINTYLEYKKASHEYNLYDFKK